MRDPFTLPEPRPVRVRIVDPPAKTATLHATLIPICGDVIHNEQAAGTSYRQPALARLARPKRWRSFPVVLIPEHTNPHDPNAIALWTRVGQVGFVPRRHCEAYRAGLARLEADYGTPIAVNGQLAEAPWGLTVYYEVPEGLDCWF